MKDKKHKGLKLVIKIEVLKPRIGVLHTKHQPNKKRKSANRVKHKHKELP